jgi:hypothetical protein
MTIRDQIMRIISEEMKAKADGEVLYVYVDDAADAILAAFPTLLIDSENHKIIAKALRDGARGDIWYDAGEYDDTGAAVLIAATWDAMEAAADILHIEEPEDDDPVQAYLKRMAERGDDEAKSLLA